MLDFHTDLCGYDNCRFTHRHSTEKSVCAMLNILIFQQEIMHHRAPSLPKMLQTHIATHTKSTNLEHLHTEWLGITWMSWKIAVNTEWKFSNPNECL